MTNRLARLDLTWHDGLPTIRAHTPDGVEWIYPLLPTEAAALVKRLASYIQQFLTHHHDDAARRDRGDAA